MYDLKFKHDNWFGLSYDKWLLIWNVPIPKYCHCTYMLIANIEKVGKYPRSEKGAVFSYDPFVAQGFCVS